jgi:hypothetical protein
MMNTLIVPRELHARLGTEGSEGLVRMFAAYHEFSTERFDRTLERGLSEVRLEFRVEMERIRVEVHSIRADLIKWNLLFWVTQFAGMCAVLSYMR